MKAGETAFPAIHSVVSLRVEHVPSYVIGLTTTSPRLSWTVTTDAPDWFQVAYEIEVVAGRSAPQRVSEASTDSVLVPWPVAPLRSRDRKTVRVRVQGPDGTWSSWSEALRVEAGLLTTEEWAASFIGAGWSEDSRQDNPPIVLRRAFELPAEVESARLYITAWGTYHAEVNGRAVSDDVLTPGWTPYPKRLRYQTYDVTDLLTSGENVLGATIADGWFRGRLGFHGDRAIYGDRLALLAQLEVTCVDGSLHRIATDADWLAGTGEIRSSSLYDGEHVDFRDAVADWSSSACLQTLAWRPVDVLQADLGALVGPSSPPVRRAELLSPVAVSTAASGAIIVDFGQNLVGWLRMRVRGKRGQTITARHAEMLENGELCTRVLRTAQQTDSFVLRGDDVEVLEPTFTIHGFRYAEISGWPGALEPGAIEAVVVHSDMARTGHFECSNALVTRLHENAVWSMRGNFVDIPTDCPQRDERLGWTGDAQVFAPSAAFLHDCAGVLDSWLLDLGAEQRSDGLVPIVVPEISVMPDYFEGAAIAVAAWGDAAVIVPWVLYERYGDLGILSRQFASMSGWVNHVRSIASPSGLWNTSDFQLGDWLDPNAPEGHPELATTPPDLVATAYFARSATLVARSAELLGRDDDARNFGDLARRVRDAFRDEYLDETGAVATDTPTGYALAIAFDLLDEDERTRAGLRLAELAEANGFNISTGFVGTPLMCDALSTTGHTAEAYRLLMQTSSPSWLYPVTLGATTIWERWDAVAPDGTITDSDMISFNHYALGSVVDWLHRVVAGLAPAAAGYRHLVVAPEPGGGLTWAAASLRTPYGIAAVRWDRDTDLHSLTVAVRVPPNSRATVILPRSDVTATETIEVGSGQYSWTVPFH